MRHSIRAAGLVAAVAFSASALAQAPGGPTGPAKGGATPPAKAAPATCKLQAGDKKLAGAALQSFMKKCEGDAKAACDKTAADRKLAGAAKDSFTKKCVADAAG